MKLEELYFNLTSSTMEQNKLQVLYRSITSECISWIYTYKYRDLSAANTIQNPFYKHLLAYSPPRNYYRQRHERYNHQVQILLSLQAIRFPASQVQRVIRQRLRRYRCPKQGGWEGLGRSFAAHIRRRRGCHGWEGWDS